MMEGDGMVSSGVAVDVADFLNREYQAGGDMRTLVNVTAWFAGYFQGLGAMSADNFYEIANMGGLPVGSAARA
jgi:hypothetical protein